MLMKEYSCEGNRRKDNHALIVIILTRCTRVSLAHGSTEEEALLRHSAVVRKVEDAWVSHSDPPIQAAVGLRKTIMISCSRSRRGLKCWLWWNNTKGPRVGHTSLLYYTFTF